VWAVSYFFWGYLSQVWDVEFNGGTKDKSCYCKAQLHTQNSTLHSPHSTQSKWRSFIIQVRRTSEIMHSTLCILHFCFTTILAYNTLCTPTGTLHTALQLYHPTKYSMKNRRKSRNFRQIHRILSCLSGNMT
jgi:hypothetical protein